MNLGDAEAAISALDAAGIECTLADDNLVGIDWGVALAVGGVKVLVHGDDLAEAQGLLTQSPLPLAGEGGAPAPGEGRPIVCPDCGSPDLERIPRARIFGLLTAVFIGIGVAVGQVFLALTALLAVAAGVLLMPSTRCRACKHRWNPPVPERAAAPPPDSRDTIEEPCPRCGSLDVHRIDYRRLKAIPLLFNPAIFIAAPLWLLKPARRCDACGLEL